MDDRCEQLVGAEAVGVYVTQRQPDAADGCNAFSVQRVAARGQPDLGGKRDVPWWQTPRVWPSLQLTSRSASDRAPFSPSVEWPKLRVVVDPQAELPDIVLQYLGHLRQSDQGVRVLRRVPGPALPEVGDYEVIPPRPETGGEYAGVREHRETGIALIGVPSARNNVIAAFNWAEHEGFDPDAAKARQLDAEAARSLNADVYATDNVFLLNRRNAHTALAILDAMAVIGLRQRARGRVVLDGSLDGLVTTWQAEMMQSRVLLPGTSALFAEDTRTPGKGAVRLVGAATQRLGKALSARDKLLLSSLQRHRSFGTMSLLEPRQMM